MAYTVISHVSAPTSNVIDMTSLSLGGYYDLQLRISNVTVGTDDTYVLLQFYVSGSLVTTNYKVNVATMETSGASAASGSNTAAGLWLTRQTVNWGLGNATGESLSAVINIRNATSSAYKQAFGVSMHVRPPPHFARSVCVGQINNTGTLDGFRVAVASGTMTAGTATLYGLQ